MKNIFSFTAFIIKLEYNVRIFIIIKMLNYAFVLLFINDHAFVCTSKYLNNYNTPLYKI